MKSRRLLALIGSICLILVLAVLPFMTACAPKEVQTIKVGWPTFITGELAAWWPGTELGGLMVLDVINRDPPLGRPLEVLIEDTESTPDGGIRAANYLIGQGVIYNVGFSSDTLTAALSVIERARMPVINWCAGTPLLDKTSAGKKGIVYRTIPGDTSMIAVTGLLWENIFAPKGYKAAAVINATDDINRGQSVITKDYWEKVGAKILVHTEFPTEQRTFSRILTETFALQPDVIYLGAGIDQATIILKEWWDSALSKDIVWVVAPEMMAPEATKAMLPAPGVLDGKLYTIATPVGAEAALYGGEAYGIFMAEYQAHVGAGSEPEHPLVVYFYDAMILGALAIQAAGEATQEAVIEFVREVSNPPGVKVYSYEQGKKALDEGKEINYEGSGGTMDFDEYGNVYAPGAIFVLSGVKFEQVKTFSEQEVLDFMVR